MNNVPFVQFIDLSFTYPSGENPVYEGFSGTLPSGFVSLLGPNGSGKSTLMLLAAGRLIPQKGNVLLFGRDTKSFRDEDERNAYASFVYQNMEFETGESLGELLEYIYDQGKPAEETDNQKQAFLSQVESAFQLTKLKNKSLSKLSKGQMQQTLMAFSVLYGSQSIFMDEPVFAMEEYQKELALDFLRDYQKRKNVTIYLSLHQLELTRKYAGTVILIGSGRDIEIGSPAEIITPESLEKAYGVPAAMLKEKEFLDRKKLEEEADLFKSGN